MTNQQILDHYYSLSENEVKNLTIDQCNKIQHALNDNEYFFTDNIDSF